VLLICSSSGFSPLLIYFCLLFYIVTRIDQDNRYAHPERDRERDRGNDRTGRRGDGPRGGGRQQIPPPSQSQDDRRSREGFQNIPTGPRAERSKGPTNQDVTMSSSSMPPPPVPITEPSSTYVPPMTETDLSAIRSRYLGVDKKRRKIRKMNDRKFVFDWDAQDDTFAEDSPVAVGSNRQGAQVMFGRGRLAGMDDGGGTGPRRSTNNNNGAADTQLADQRERRKAEKAGFDDRHWTEKPLEEMKERDWRIFREDFSISARGQFHLIQPLNVDI
jgi:ATP-dependent RNA helicase DDX23/PRP28